MSSLRESVLQSCARRPDEPETDRLFRCAEILEEVCQKNQHAELLNEYLDEHLSDSALDEDEYREILTSGRFLILAQSEDALLTALRQPYVVERIHCARIRHVERNVSPGLVSVNKYSTPGDFVEDCFDDRVQLTKISSEQAVRNALIVKDLHDVIDITDISDLPRISIRISFPLVGRYEWSFSRETLRAVAHTSLSLIDSGAAGILDLLGSMRSPDTAPVVERLLHHPEHFVRWKAVQTMAKLDPERGLELVKDAVGASHPMIRAAAKATLERHSIAV